MESIYAALLLHKAGSNITATAIEKILKAAGLTPDKSEITKVVSGLKDKDINTIISSAAAAPVMAAAPASQEAAAGKKEAEKKEEEPEEEPTGIGSLF